MKFTVYGMSCDKCKEKIINSLNQIEGVKAVSVDLDSKIVEIDCSGVDENTLKEAILDLGFDV